MTGASSRRAPGGPRSAAWALLVAMGMVATTLVGSSLALAADASSAAQELARSRDFRVRVSAALVLGRTRPDGARPLLERALDDAHPAVRVAAAEALGTIGDVEATAVLERHLASEASPNARAQIRTTLAKLRAAGETTSATRPTSGRRSRSEVHYVVAIGTMRNTTSVRGDDLRRVLACAARIRARSLAGAAVGQSDSVLLRQAAGKRVPVITLDGNVTQLTEARVAGSVQIHAAVEFTVRRDQSLKGTASGAATTFGSGPELSDEGRRRLEDEAIDGAVQSALHGVEQDLIVAAR